MLGHADSKELQSSKGDVNTLPLKKQVGAREELFLLRKRKHVQDGAAKNELKCNKMQHRLAQTWVRVTAIGKRATGRDLLGKEGVGALHKYRQHGTRDFRLAVSARLVCERAHPQVGKRAF